MVTFFVVRYALLFCWAILVLATKGLNKIIKPVQKSTVDEAFKNFIRYIMMACETRFTLVTFFNVRLALFLCWAISPQGLNKIIKSNPKN